MRYWVLAWMIPLIMSIALMSLLVDGSHGEPSTLYTLDNRRNVDSVWMDLSSAKTREYKTTTINPFSPIVASDVDLDGHQEIFFATDSGELVMFSTKSTEYTYLLKSDEGERFLYSPQLVDIDFDSLPELIVYDMGGDRIRCLNLTSGEEPWTIEGNGEMNPQPKVIVDESARECWILVDLGEGRIALFDTSGKRVWMRSFPSINGPTGLAVADVDIDGDLEYVVAWGGNADGTPTVGIEICDLTTSEIEKNWSWHIDAQVTTPPLCYDLVVDEPGLEVAFCTDYAGVLVISTHSGNVLWQHDVDYLSFISLNVIETNSHTILIATSGTLILSLKGSDGTVICSRTIRHYATVLDIPFTGFFDIDGPNRVLLYSSYKYVQAFDPLTNSTKWIYDLPDGVRRCRCVCLKGSGDDAFSLHIFFWFVDEKKTEHIKLRVYSEETISISVAPPTNIAYPGVLTQISGIKIVGIGDGPEQVKIRLYGSRDHAIINYYEDVQTVSIFTDGLSIEGMTSDSSGDTLILGFRIRPPWLAGTRPRLSMEVLIVTKDNTNAFGLFEDYIFVEKSVDLVGQPFAVDLEGNRYDDGDWILNGSSVTLRGPFLYFTDSSVPPLPSDVNITIDVRGKDTTPGTLDAAGEVLADTLIERESDGPVQFEITISMRWTLQRFVLDIHLIVDGTPPQLLAVYPESDLWFAEDKVVTGCLATDGNGSGILEFQIQHGPHGSQLGGWQSIDGAFMNRMTAEGREDLALSDGSWDVVWRAIDGVGLVSNMSEILTIHIDTSDIEFSSFSPNGWSNQTLVNVSIKLEDINGSGIDMATVSYAVSPDGLFGFSDWYDLGFVGTQDEIMIRVEIEFDEGLDNYMKFRASDVAGNERESSSHRVMVDLTPPEIQMIVPGPQEIIDNLGTVVCVIAVVDSLSDVNTSMVRYSYRAGEGTFMPWNNADGDGASDGQFRAQITFSDVETIELRWRVSDLAGNVVTTDSYNVRVNRPPRITDIQPSSPMTVKENARVTFEVHLEDPEGDSLSVVWMMDNKELSNETDFSISLPLGRHQVRLYVNDGHGNSINESLELTVVEETVVFVGPTVFLPILVAVLVVLIIVGTYLKRRGHK